LATGEEPVVWQAARTVVDARTSARAAFLRDLPLLPFVAAFNRMPPRRR